MARQETIGGSEEEEEESVERDKDRHDFPLRRLGHSLDARVEQDDLVNEWLDHWVLHQLENYMSSNGVADESHLQGRVVLLGQVSLDDCLFVHYLLLERIDLNRRPLEVIRMGISDDVQVTPT